VVHRADRTAHASLVDIDARRLELYRRDGAHWLLLEDATGSGLRLESVDLTLHSDQAFEDLPGI
jgi:hypothetical protein